MSPPRREPIASAVRLPPSAVARKMPAMMIAKSDCTTAPPAPEIRCRMVVASAVSWRWYLRSAVSGSLAARLQFS